jgi:hypothetical protein
MSESEFRSIKNKDDWRRRFAVWAHWNSNGEYITYVVPPGPGMNVWEGITASQQMRGTSFTLEGGAHQIVADPKDFIPTNLSRRHATNWGYDDLSHVPSLIGVPVLANKVQQ